MVKQLLNTCIITKYKQYANVYSRIQRKGYTHMKLSPFTHVLLCQFNKSHQFLVQGIEIFRLEKLTLTGIKYIFCFLYNT